MSRNLGRYQNCDATMEQVNMLRKFATLIAMCSIGIGSANASTLYIAGAAGTPDKLAEALPNGQANGCLADVPRGAMAILPGPPFPNTNTTCLVSYPINLPAGSTIDGVEIAYRDDYGGAMQHSIAAYLGVNRVKPDMGPIAVAGTNNAAVPFNVQSYSNMGPLSIPMILGDTYWVQVDAHNISRISYVAVTYH